MSEVYLVICLIMMVIALTGISTAFILRSQRKRTLANLLELISVGGLFVFSVIQCLNLFENFSDLNIVDWTLFGLFLFSLILFLYKLIFFVRYK